MTKQTTKAILWFTSEKEKIAPLPSRQKAQYIWEYYKLWIIGILSAVILLGYVVHRAFFTVKDYWFYAVFANTMAPGGNGSALWEDFTDYAGFDLSRKNVQFNASSFFDPSVASGTANSYYQAFVAVVEAGDLDVVTLERDGLTALGSSGRLLDLTDPKAQAIYETCQDRLVTCIPYDTEYSTDPVPIGIDLSDSLLVTRYHLYDDSCVLGIGAYSQRLDAVETFLDFVLQE